MSRDFNFALYLLLVLDHDLYSGSTHVTTISQVVYSQAINRAARRQTSLMLQFRFEEIAYKLQSFYEECLKKVSQNAPRRIVQMYMI